MDALFSVFVSGRDSNRDKMIPLVPVGVTNRDKRFAHLFVPVGATNRDKKAPILSRLVAPTGIKSSCPFAGLASRWTRDKSYLLFRVQR